jgi:hypothetical protein
MSKPSKQFVICVNNEGYWASLEKRKIYVALRDPAAEKHAQLRVIDESGEDYLYQRHFSVRSCCRSPSRRQSWLPLDRSCISHRLPGHLALIELGWPASGSGTKQD